ncbi:MAG: hypothetical protein ACHREM_12820, partial [Polyangiales bacterium]
MDGVYVVDLKTVRESDFKAFFEVVLGLINDAYSVLYYREAEYFVALAPCEAIIIAETLGGVPHNGRGRRARKHYLLEDFEVSFNYGVRAKTPATVDIYRIDRGATAAYKLEVRVRLRSRDSRRRFLESDRLELRRALEALVREFDLHPLAKPARWEPLVPEDSSHPRVPSGWRLGQRAYRGSRLSRSQLGAVSDCNTPLLLSTRASDEQTHAFPPPGRIRSLRAPSSSSSGGVVDDVFGGPLGGVVREIHTFPGFLSEVILDPETDPVSLVDALGSSGGKGTMGLSVLAHLYQSQAPDTWTSLIDRLDQYPVPEDPRSLDTWAIVVDPSIAAYLTDLVGPSALEAEAAQLLASLTQDPPGLFGPG